MGKCKAALYKVKNSNNEYFVDWVGDNPIFNSSFLLGDVLTLHDANCLRIVLSDAGVNGCSLVPLLTDVE